MTTETYSPAKLEFYSFGMYSYAGRAQIQFSSSKGHQISVQTTDEDLDVLKSIIDRAKARALKEIPEVIAEVIAEERVAAILAKREADLLESKPLASTTEEEVF